MKQQICNFILYGTCNVEFSKGKKMDQKQSGWDRSNQKILGGINFFSMKTCMGQSFEMGF